MIINDDFIIGRGYNYYPTVDTFSLTKIPVVRIYNRGLSTDEISQNFEAIRGRYAI